MVLALAGIAAATGCQKADVGPWFEGSFDAALQEADSRGEMVFLEFYSDT
jgi:hypothetical protein